MATIERAIPVGGASLNFKVVGGTAEPVNPKENTIWVNEPVFVANWVFSADEPTEPLNETVWFKTATAGGVAFNALRKNAIEVRPIGASYYLNGKWAAANAKIYRNGAWAYLTTYLYNKGDECTEITGGWTNVNGMSENGYTNTGTYTNNGESYTLSANSPGVIHRITKNIVNLSDVTRIYVKTISPTVFHQIVVSSSNTTISGGTMVANASSSGPGTASLDVSSLTGSYYVAVRHINGAGNPNPGSVTVSQIWME